MAGNKKPLKKYQRGRILSGGHLPLPNKVKDEAETAALMALTALKQGFYNKAMGLNLVLFLNQCKVILGDDMERMRMLATMYAALNCIIDRYNKTGKWGATGDELRYLTEHMPIMVEAYRGASRALALKAEESSNLKLRRALNEKRKLAKGG